MKKAKKKFIAIFAGCMFAMLMMLNVSTTINGSNFSVNGYTALVSGSTGGSGCYQLYCLNGNCYSNQNLTNSYGIGGTLPCTSSRPC